jgi:hypothetical protein
VGETSIVLWITASVYRIPIFLNPNQNRAAANQKAGFYANHDPNKQEVGFIFARSGSELRTLIKYSRSKIKN